MRARRRGRPGAAGRALADCSSPRIEFQPSTSCFVSLSRSIWFERYCRNAGVAISAFQRGYAFSVTQFAFLKCGTAETAFLQLP